MHQIRAISYVEKFVYEAAPIFKYFQCRIFGEKPTKYFQNGSNLVGIIFFAQQNQAKSFVFSYNQCKKHVFHLPLGSEESTPYIFGQGLKIFIE